MVNCDFRIILLETISNVDVFFFKKKRMLLSVFVSIDLDPFLVRNIFIREIFFVWKFHGTKSVLIEDYCYFINLLIQRLVFSCVPVIVQ